MLKEQKEHNEKTVAELIEEQEAAKRPQQASFNRLMDVLGTGEVEGEELQNLLNSAFAE